MKRSLKNPLTAALLCFFVACCLICYCSVIVKWVIAISVSLLLLGVLLFRHPRLQNYRRFLIGLLTALLLATSLSLAFFDYLYGYYSAQNGTEDTVRVQVMDCEYSLSYTARYKVKILSSTRLPKGTKILLDSDMISLTRGDVLEGTIRYASLSEASSPSFDGMQYYLPKGIVLTAETQSVRQLGNERIFSLSLLFSDIQKSLSDKILAHVGSDAGGLASAVLLGTRDNLSDSLMRDFRRLGISHLLVVSGTHFSVLLTFAETAMRRLRMRRPLRAAVAIPMILAFMLLTGFTPSVVRAGVMHLLAQFSMLLYRKPNRIHSFALAGSLLVLVNPYSAMDCGLHLSFAATYGCFLYIEYRSYLILVLRKRGFVLDSKIKRGVFSVIEISLMTCLVTLSTLPLTWLYFGEISLFSIPFNIIFIPLVTILMYIAGLYLLLYPVPFMIPLTGLLLLGYCELLQGIAGYFSRFDWVMVPVNYSFTAFFLIPLTLLLFALPFLSHKKFKTALLAALILCVSFFATVGIAVASDRANTYVSYLPENKNDGFVLKSDGKILLCEISDGSKSYLYNLTEEMSALHCCEVEAIFIIHYHNKHVQLLENLAQREILRSVILCEPMDEREAGIYASLLETAELYGLSAVTVKTGEVYSFGNAEICLLDRHYLSRSTHPITAVEITVDETSTVIASCSFNEADECIVQSLEEADYPILGGHSPVYKKAFTLACTEAKALFVSEQAVKWDETDRHPYPVIRGETALRIKIKGSDSQYTREEAPAAESESEGRS